MKKSFKFVGNIFCVILVGLFLYSFAFYAYDTYSLRGTEVHASEESTDIYELKYGTNGNECVLTLEVSSYSKHFSNGTYIVKYILEDGGILLVRNGLAYLEYDDKINCYNFISLERVK